MFLKIAKSEEVNTLRWFINMLVKKVIQVNPPNCPPHKCLGILDFLVTSRISSKFSQILSEPLPISPQPPIQGIMSP